MAKAKKETNYGMDWAFRRIIRYAEVHGLKVLTSNDIKSEG